MLVLSRYCGEKIILEVLKNPEDPTDTTRSIVTVEVVQVEGGRVRLGIDAEDHVKIRREEVPSIFTDKKEKAA